MPARHIIEMVGIYDVGVKILRKASLVTPVTEIIAARKYELDRRYANREPIMSSVQLYETTKQRVDRKRGDYGFILALVCMGLALVVASAIFRPAPVGTDVNDQIWFVGP